MAESGNAGSEVPPHFVDGKDSKTLNVRHADTLHVGNVDTVHVGDIHHHHHHHPHVSTSYREMEVDANIEPINKAGAFEADPMILQRLQKVLSDYQNPGKWRNNRELCFELVSLFQDKGNAVLTKVRFDSVHFFVTVKLGPDHDAFLRACTHGTLSRGLTKLLVTPELEEAAGVKLRVRLDVKATPTTIEDSAPAGRMTSLTDMKLNEIGDALGDNGKLPALGLHLGFTETEVNMFLATNRVDGKVSPKGTKNMLSAWRENTPGADQVMKLGDALVAAELGHVAENHL